MTDHAFPAVASYPLPAEALRAPLPSPDKASAETAASPNDPRSRDEALLETISAAIARRARQRRYTP